MSTIADTPLAQKLAGEPARAKTAADGAISGLATVAGSLNMRESAGKLRETAAHLASDTFQLIVMGRFKNGKSTLLNALLGGTTHPVELEGHRGPMIVDDLPATAKLTGVHYADEPYVKVWGFDGKAESWPLARYLRESTLDNDEEESQRRLAHVQEFEMGFPAKLCQAGVVVYDSPGLDDHESRTVLTRQATKRCDAAIVVYRSDTLMGQGELADTSKVVQGGARVFTVVNLHGSRKVDDRLRGFVWNRYVRDQLGGPAWNGQDLSQYDIYFVNALQARDGRYTEDPALVAESNLPALETALANFLLRERQEAHLKKFVTEADLLAAVVEQHITQRRAAAQTDQAGLRETYQAMLPKLAAIRARTDKLPKVFERYRAEAEIDLVSSFTQTVTRMRQELPGHLEATPLPSAQRLTMVFQQKKLQAEAAEIISDFATSRLETWSEDDVSSVMDPLLERLANDIRDEIAAIGREFDAVHVELGWSGPQAGGAVVGTTERVVSAVAGLLFGDLVGALTGGAGGARGAIGSIAGTVGAAVLLGVVGVSAAPIVVPAVLAAAFFGGSLGGGVGLEKRVKADALKRSDEGLAELPEKTRGDIAVKLSAAFRDMQSVVTREISQVIEEEERHIRELVELNQREQADKDRELAAMSEASTALGKHRLALQQALLTARQTA